MSRIYSSSSYQLGAAQIGGQLGADANSITVTEKAQAEREIKKMRSALEKWLKYRTLLGTPATDATPVEQRLGKRLYILLCEMFDSSKLPPESAVIQLAQIAVAGKLSNESATPSAVGFIWLWPAVAVVGLVMLTVVTKIRSDADDAADERKTQCIMAGKCTDTGFWLKVGGAALIAWLAWEKFGLKKMMKAGTD